MLIEAVEGPITYRWPGGEVRLEVGKPVELPPERARKLLRKASGKVRAVSPIPSGACRACGKSRYWLSVHDTLICGICHPPADSSLIVEWLEG